MHEVIEKAGKEGIKAVIFDKDFTLTKKEGDKVIGYGVFKQERDNKNVNALLNGLWGRLKIKASSMWDGTEESSRNVKILYDSIGKSRCLSRQAAYSLGSEHIKEDTIEGVPKFMQEIKEKKWPIFLSTMGSNISADAALHAYGMDGRVSQPIKYSTDDLPITESEFYLKGRPSTHASPESKVLGCKAVIEDPRKKKIKTQDLLSMVNLDLGDCMYVGDNNKLDSPIYNAVKISASSPMADSESRKNTTCIIKSYAG
jgi:phosphoglycolate phosphatase-like HAD superfamily hydrolase